MKLCGRLAILVPMVLAVVAFVLSMLALFAGHKQGFMEDYAIVRLNTSMVGHNLLDTSSEKEKSGDKKKDGLLGHVQGWWDDKKNDAKDKINNVTGHIADKLAKNIGIKEWYSLHVMDSCEGYYSPNSTAPGVGLNITNCTTSSPDSRFNLSQILDKELTAGPVKLNLASIEWPDSIQERLDDINQAILGMFVVYAIGAGLSGLAFLSSILALWKPDLRRIVLANFVISSLGFLSLLIGSIIVTVAAKKGVKGLNKAGEKVGLSATTGTKFYTLSWVSTGFMGIVALFWLGQFCAVRRDRKRRGLNEKHVKHIDS
ncbi:hypothetical protein EsDP_00000027 [Epichloe bromicola]|uniref:SUR7 protein n=1 Tax=Epichloe bromicola TaxID=79588 RepID=A0ABQ0CDS0_9HYPO